MFPFSGTAPRARMAPADLGTALWALVYHLYRAATSPAAGRRAFAELTLRTGTPCHQSDLAVATDVRHIPDTAWYKEMCTRYTAARDAVQRTHAADLTETRSVIKEMYPGGCTLSELADTVQTCVSMLSFTIPHERTERFVVRLSDRLATRAAAGGGVEAYQLTAAELTRHVVDDLVLEALLPVRWWRPLPDAAAPAVAVRVGLRVRPTEVWVEYRVRGDAAATTRRRRIGLAHLLQPTGPTATLARRLANSHDALVSEEQWQRVLIRLQQLLRRAAATEDTRAKTPTTAVPELYASPLREPDTTMPRTAVTVGDAAQRADVGLLYRDPEAALVNVDLNDADEVTLREFKAAMETTFKQHALRPGDAGYVYDKRVDVVPATQRSEWDND